MQPATIVAINFIVGAIVCYALFRTVLWARERGRRLGYDEGRQIGIHEGITKGFEDRVLSLIQDQHEAGHEMPETLNEYQVRVLRTAGKHDGGTFPDRVVYFALGLAGEAGEVADIAKKVYFHKHPFTPELKHKMLEELGDCFWYIAALAYELGFTLADVAWTNVRKLNKRYANGFSTEASIARVDTTNAA